MLNSELPSLALFPLPIAQIVGAFHRYAAFSLVFPINHKIISLRQLARVGQTVL